MTNTMTLERKSSLVMPSHYVELDNEEMSYVDGGAWWNVLGYVLLFVGFGLETSATLVSAYTDYTDLAVGLGITGSILSLIGGLLTGYKSK